MSSEYEIILAKIVFMGSNLLNLTDFQDSLYIYII
jgi:hypothetical protein